MFIPTHIYHHSANSFCKQTFPNGVPVMLGSRDEYGLMEWVADDQGNVAGYSTDGDSYVVPIE